jgi:hypothetical protein
MQWTTTKLTDSQRATLVLDKMTTCSAGARKRICEKAAEYRCSGAESGIVISEEHYCEVHKDEHERNLGLHSIISN